MDGHGSLHGGVFPGMTPSDHRHVMERCISRGTAFCACMGKTIAGGVAFSPDYGGVGFLAVRKEFRRHGLGTLLMKEALSHMPPERETLLHVYPEDSPARAFYLSLGFRPGEFIRKEGHAYQTLRVSPEKGSNCCAAPGNPLLAAVPFDGRHRMGYKGNGHAGFPFHRHSSVHRH